MDTIPTQSALQQALIDADLGAYAHKLLAFKRQCLRLHTHPTQIPTIGATRIGGLPDLPRNFSWPMHNGRPCEFIAQLNFAEIAPHDFTGTLPTSGILFVFYDGLEYEDPIGTPDQTGAEVLHFYTGPLHTLQPAQAFPSALEFWQRYNPCSVTYHPDWMLPAYFAYASVELEKTVFAYTRYSQIPPALERFRKVVGELEPYADSEKHHMFGYCEPILQDDPLYELPNGLGDDAEEWLLLLQISSDQNTGMLWGDTSTLYYMIRKPDLIQHNFDAVICIQQNL